MDKVGWILPGGIDHAVLQVVVPELGTSSAWEHSWEQSGNNKDFHGLFSVVFDVPMFHQVVDNKRVSRTFKALVLGSSPSPLTTSTFPTTHHCRDFSPRSARVRYRATDPTRWPSTYSRGWW
jgi:hypothetical protein